VTNDPVASLEASAKQHGERADFFEFLADHISAVIVTRGDVDLSPVLDSLPFRDVVVWDNSRRERNALVYGRYLAIAEAKHDIIYTQDDDALIDAERLVQEWDGSYTSLFANMPRDRMGDRITMIGWGALFYRDLPELAFRRFLDHYPLDHLFMRTCDVVFAALTPSLRTDLGHTDLPHAYAPGRMYRKPDHFAERSLVFSRADRLSRGVLPLQKPA
jgi:hypothetical protein